MLNIIVRSNKPEFDVWRQVNMSMKITFDLISIKQHQLQRHTIETRLIGTLYLKLPLTEYEGNCSSKKIWREITFNDLPHMTDEN